MQTHAKEVHTSNANHSQSALAKRFSARPSWARGNVESISLLTESVVCQHELHIANPEQGLLHQLLLVRTAPFSRNILNTQTPRGMGSPAQGILLAFFVDEKSAHRDQYRQVRRDREDFPGRHTFEEGARKVCTGDTSHSCAAPAKRL